AGCRIEQLLNVQRRAVEPGLKSGRSQEIVELHRQGKTVLRGEKRLDIHPADLRHRRRLNALNDCGKIQIAALSPRMAENCREQDMLTALNRIGVDSEDRKS